MFRFKSLYSTTTSSNNPSSTDTSGGIVDQSDELEDPLILRLNHQRQLHEEKSNRKASYGGDSEVFVGWQHTEKDPFDLESTTSSEDEISKQAEESSFTVDTKHQDGEANFLGWGAGSSSDMDESKSQELLFAELSIRGGLSESTASPAHLLHLHHQRKSGENESEIDHSSLTCSTSKHRMSPESIDENASFDFDESTSGRVSTPISSAINSGRKSACDRPTLFRCSINQDTEVSKSPLPRQDHMFRRSTTCSNQSHTDCDNRSTLRMSRRQSFSDLLSASLRNIGAENLADLIQSDDVQSQQSLQRSIKISKENIDECPRLQQLKEQSVEELHNELVRIQVQSKSNLEKSWAEAERIRQSNDELDNKISQLKAKLEKTKATASDAIHRNSPSQESCIVSTKLEVAQPISKLPIRNFSSVALNALLGSNFNVEDEQNENVRLGSKLDVNEKKPRARRRTFMGDFSSVGSAGSGVGMTLDESSERNMDVMSGFYKQCFDNQSTSGSAIICQTLSRDEWENKPHTGSNVIIDSDNVSDVRSAIDSLHSSDNAPVRDERTIFEAEAMKLKLEDLNEQLAIHNDGIMKVEAALEKQIIKIESCAAELQRCRSGEQVKKLQELEHSTVHEMADFNRCFRAIDGKLETIEAIEYEIKQVLELDKSGSRPSFKTVQLDKEELCQAQDTIADDNDRLRVLSILNDSFAFHHYQDCREKIVGNIYRIDFLEADLLHHLVQIRLLIEQVGDDDEGTQTTESSMASERRALERVFVESILPHIQLALITKNNLLVGFRENVKMLKWWNHVIDGMKCFKANGDMAPCMDFINKEPAVSLEKDVRVLGKILEVTSGYLEDIKTDVKQECRSFRSKVERAGLAFNNSSASKMSVDNSKPSAKNRSLYQSNNLMTNNLKSKILGKGRVIAEKDKLLKHQAAQLESLHTRANEEFKAQIEMLDKMQSQLTLFTRKMVEQDTLVSSLTEIHAKKTKRVLRFENMALFQGS
jgi:hypothetical protein